MEEQEKTIFTRNTRLCDLVMIVYETKFFKKIKQHEIAGYVGAMTYKCVGVCSKNPSKDKPSFFCNRPAYITYDKIKVTSRLYENPTLERDEM